MKKEEKAKTVKARNFKKTGKTSRLNCNDRPMGNYDFWWVDSSLC